MSSDKSPFKQGLTPRPLKNREPRKKINTISVTTKDIYKTRKKGRKAPAIDFAVVRWHIYYMGTEHYVSKKRGLSEALKEFTTKWPERRISQIVPVQPSGRAYKGAL